MTDRRVSNRMEHVSDDAPEEVEENTKLGLRKYMNSIKFSCLE